ncbi:MAG: hypothetical protein SGPRY_004062 [Prymnesium sp.]
MPRFLLGLELPMEAEGALRALGSLGCVDELLGVLLDHAGGQPLTPAAFRHLQQACSLNADDAGTLFTGMDWIARTCMRSSLKARELAAELTDLKVPPELVAPIVDERLSGNRKTAQTEPISRPWTCCVGD